MSLSPAEAVAGPSSLPSWRLEVAQKVEAYRARRPAAGGPSAPDSQTNLPFFPSAETLAARPPARAVAAPLTRAARRERVMIAVHQRELDFSASDHPNTEKAPIAPLALRCRAGLYDALFLLGAYAGFLGLFQLLGGRLALGKLDVAIDLAALVLLCAQYFALFTTFGQVTLGMRLAGLELVSFDGKTPSLPQLLWRSFGYVIAAGAGFLGFLWSLWDEDHLTWQDRISQTYLARSPVAEATAREVQASDG